MAYKLEKKNQSIEIVLEEAQKLENYNMLSTLDLKKQII